MEKLISDNIEALTKEIEQKRRQMLETASVQGMGSDKTLEVSQELDALILEYQKISHQ